VVKNEKTQNIMVNKEDVQGPAESLMHFRNFGFVLEVREEAENF
jgi:hypothetical protein